MDGQTENEVMELDDDQLEAIVGGVIELPEDNGYFNMKKQTGGSGQQDSSES